MNIGTQGYPLPPNRMTRVAPPEWRTVRVLLTTTSGLTVPQNVFQIGVAVWGGGGNGGTTGPGGGGGFGFGIYDCKPGNILPTFTVGAIAGTSSFGTLITATGGVSNTLSAAGGTGTVNATMRGAFIASGGRGGNNATGGGGGGGSFYGNGGNGGDSAAPAGGGGFGGNGGAGGGGGGAGQGNHAFSNFAGGTGGPGSANGDGPGLYGIQGSPTSESIFLRLFKQSLDGGGSGAAPGPGPGGGSSSRLYAGGFGGGGSGGSSAFGGQGGFGGGGGSSNTTNGGNGGLVGGGGGCTSGTAPGGQGVIVLYTTEGY